MELLAVLCVCHYAEEWRKVVQKRGRYGEIGVTHPAHFFVCRHAEDDFGFSASMLKTTTYTVGSHSSKSQLSETFGPTELDRTPK